MSTYISLYRDADGSVFVGDTYEIDTEQEMQDALASEQLAIQDISVIEQIDMCEIKNTILRGSLV